MAGQILLSIPAKDCVGLMTGDESTGAAKGFLWLAWCERHLKVKPPVFNAAYEGFYCCNQSPTA